ncbi:Uncharacterised protein [Vibrio cholerae]|nr:Uncharacterised protein [Vibrio cholerae]
MTLFTDCFFFTCHHIAKVIHNLHFEDARVEHQGGGDLLGE